MLKIKTNNGYLDLSSDFTMEIDETSPVMNDRGSQTVPITVPCTPANCRALGFPHRLDMAKAPLDGNAKCIITDGVYKRTGTINICSASRQEGITLNIGFDNSEAYSKWQDKKLSNIENLPRETYSSVSELCTHLQSVMAGLTASDKYGIFQAVIKNEYKETEEPIYEGATETKTVRTYYPIYLNETYFDGNNYVLVYGDRQVDMIVDGDVMNTTLPIGYGVSPFLYLWYVVELVFKDLGYNIKSNPFKTDAELARIVLMNNSIDCCCTGTLYFADLMPDCSIEEFLHSLYVRFGMVYFLSSETNVADLRFIRDIIKDEPLQDFSNNIKDEPMITYEAPRQVALSAGYSFEGAEPSTELFEDFIKGKHGIIYGVKDIRQEASHYGYVGQTGLDGIFRLRNGFEFEWATGRFYVYDPTPLEGNLLLWNPTRFSFYSSCHFKWNPKSEGVDVEDLNSVDEQLPMAFADNGYLSPQYLAGPRHRYTYVKLSSDEDVSEDGEDETPLSFCFAFIKPANSYTFGSVLPYDITGDFVNWGNAASSHHLSLLFCFENGLYAQFWRGYDEMLRSANRLVEVEGRIKLTDIMDMNTLIPVSLRGQRVLWDNLKYSLPAKSMVDATLAFRTIRHTGTAGSVPVPELELQNSNKTTYHWVISGDDGQHTDADHIRKANAYGQSFLDNQNAIYEWLSYSLDTTNMKSHPSIESLVAAHPKPNTWNQFSTIEIDTGIIVYVRYDTGFMGTWAVPFKYVEYISLMSEADDVNENTNSAKRTQSILKVKQSEIRPITLKPVKMDPDDPDRPIATIDPDGNV